MGANRERIAEPVLVSHRYRGRMVKVYKLSYPRNLIGSSRRATIRIPSAEIANEAIAIEYRKGTGWIVVDLNSGESRGEMNGKGFTEAKVDSDSKLNIGEHSFGFCIRRKSRQLFDSGGMVPKTGPAHMINIVKYDGRILKVLDQDDLGYVTSLPKDPRIELIKMPMAKEPFAGREKLGLEEELKRPTKGVLSAVLVLLVLLMILRSPQETVDKPAANIYMRMITDSKIVAQRKSQLKSYGQVTPKGTGNGNGEISEGAKGMTSKTSKAINNLRTTGVQSLISKIAKQASRNANLLKALSFSPGSEAPTKSLGQGAGMSQGAANGKAGILGNGKGYTVNGIGTGGKGGGTGSYKAGSGLGTGNVGNGEVGLDESESVVEGGLDKEVIKQVIMANIGQIRYCYERQLSASPDLYGKLTVKFTIGANGSVVETGVGQNTINNALVEGCILRRIGTWSFPKPKGGTKVLVSYPFLLKNVK